MSRPRALDLFCGAGGASKGLHQAGFDVTGVDIAPQPRYPFKFIQADALTFPLADFDFIWASPPCQAYTPLNAYNHKVYPDLIVSVRARLRRIRVPKVIENVVQAPLLNAIMLCGPMFKLKLYRHRNFEASFPIVPPRHHPHEYTCARNGYLPTPNQPYMTITGGKHSRAWRVAAAAALGVTWMETTQEICESIPPAYAKYIGAHAMKFLRA